MCKDADALVGAVSNGAFEFILTLPMQRLQYSTINSKNTTAQICPLCQHKKCNC